VDIRLRPRCAIAPSTSRSIIDSSNACNQASASVVCRYMDQSNSQLLRVLNSVRCFLPKLLLSLDLTMWPSGQSTRAPCAVERDALSGQSSNLSLGASAYQRIISNNVYAYDKQRDNTWPEKEGSTMSFINCERC